jgi:hypothetical protein
LQQEKKENGKEGGKKQKIDHIFHPAAFAGDF